MGSGTSFELPDGQGGIAASEQFLYTTAVVPNRLHCLTHDGTEVASYEDPDKCIYSPVLAPGGLLFCVLGDGDDPEQDEIIALDAQTLQLRHRFGLSLLNFACVMTVIGEELFVCDRDNDRLQVFSFAGEHRHSITGEWKQPVALCFVKDRLYLVEENAADEDDEGELLYPLRGRRIFALSSQGDTLQVYTNSVEGQLFGGDLCCFDGKLLAPVRSGDSNLFNEVVALCGV